MIMQRRQEDWEGLIKENEQLRIENYNLKKIIEEQSSRNCDDEYQMMRRSSLQPQMEKQNLCYKCNKIKMVYKDKQELLEEFKAWSKKINHSLQEISPVLHEGMKQEADQIIVEKALELQMKSQSQIQIKRMGLLQEICLFGPSEEAIMQQTQKKFDCKYQLYLPDDHMHEKMKVYGNYFYPEDVPVKLIKEKNTSVEVDRIIFKKSSKHTDCNIYIFQCQEQFVNQPKNAFLTLVNPSKSLYAISLEFYDFLYSNNANLINQKGESKLGMRSSLSFDCRNQRSQDDKSQENNIEDRVYEENINNLSVNYSRSQSKDVGCIYKSRFCLCIMTYFPFISFFSEMLIQLIDEIKIKRMEAYSQQLNLVELDIKYFVKELSVVISRIKQKIGKFDMVMESTLDLEFGSKTVNLMLKEHTIWEEMYCGWAFKILKLFDKDTLYDLYSYFLLEESLCFICSNANTLTFAVYLFSSLLARPFFYPHPSVTLIFTEELLQTPFTAMLGVNKDTKWLEDNSQFFDQKKENKVLINLNDEHVTIKSKKKIKIPESKKLKKIINTFYKRVQKYESEFAKKKENATKEVTKSQNEIVVSFINELIGFYAEEIESFLPNRQIIQHIKSSIQMDHSSKTSNLIKDIEKYIFQMRKGKEKDLFIESLMQKQIFYVFLTTKYDII